MSALDQLDNTVDPEDIISPTFNAEDMLWHLKNDMSLLGAFCIPDTCNVKFPAAFVGMWMMLIEALYKKRDFSRFALGLPRGHGKTTVIKLLIIFTILFTKRRFILIIGASATLAENILADVCGILNSRNMMDMFGLWTKEITTDRTDLKKFRFRGREIIIAALGSGSAVRGLNIHNRRPDFIICDDMQTDEEARSETVSRKLMQWFVGTLMKAKAPDGCTYLYVGNMYKDMLIGGAHSGLYTCILRNLQKDPSWISWIVGAILADGTALWEEVQPLKQLLEELAMDRRLDQADVFFAEVLNDPKGAGNKALNIGLIPPYDIDDAIDVKVGSFIIIDPSLGQKKSDAQVVAEFDVYNGVPIMTHIHIMQVDSPKLVENVLQIAIENGHPLIVAEAAAYQASLLQWFDFIAKKVGISNISFMPISHRGIKKNSRIQSYFKSLMAGTSRLHPRVQAQVYSQATAFDVLAAKNEDDILDTGAYSQEVVLKYPEELIIPDAFQIQDNSWEHSGVQENNTVF